MEVISIILPKRYANIINRHEQKKKILSHATSIWNKQKQTEDNLFLSYPILCPLWHLHQRKQIIMKLMQFGFYFNVSDQVHTANKENLIQNVDIWLLKSKIHQWNGLSNHALLEQKKSARHWERKQLIG